MKSDDIKRAVRGSKQRRSGDAPALDHVGRMPGLGLPKRKRKRKKQRDSIRFNRRKRVASSWTWLIAVLALALLGAVAWGGFRWQQLQREKAQVDVPPVIPSPVQVKPGFPTPSETESLALVQAALAVRSPEKLPEFFHTGSSPLLGIVDFLNASEARDGRVDHCEWLGNMDVNDLQMEGVMVYQKDASGELRNRVALLVPDESGKWKIDYDAFSRAVSPSWNDLLHQQAGTGQVRIYATRQNYYNGTFVDEARWDCYGLVSPDVDGMLMGYCAKGSSTADAMNWVLSRDATSARATLEIRRVEGSDARQFEITAVLAEDWVIGKRQFDLRFGK